MPIDRYVWSLVAPTGFKVRSYADFAAFQTDILNGNVQDPRGGLLHMLMPTGVAKPPIKILYANIALSAAFDFSVVQAKDDGPVIGATAFTYFFSDGLVVRDTDGVHTRTFTRNGRYIVKVVTTDGRTTSAVITVAATGLPSLTTEEQPAEDPPVEEPPVEEPPVVKTWAELLSVLVDDNDDIDAFVSLHGVTLPAKWNKKTFEEKFSWLEANEPKA